MLDMDASAVTPTWVLAGAHQAEAGFHDPALGWVSVHAQSDSTGVHAAVIPSSSDAAQSLGGHLAGLNAYLAEHHSSVEGVTRGNPENLSLHSAMQQGSGQHPNPNPNQASDAREQPASSRGAQREDPSLTRTVSSAFTGTAGALPSRQSLESRHISVIA